MIEKDAIEITKKKFFDQFKISIFNPKTKSLSNITLRKNKLQHGVYFSAGQCLAEICFWSWKWSKKSKLKLQKKSFLINSKSPFSTPKTNLCQTLPCGKINSSMEFIFPQGNFWQRFAFGAENDRKRRNWNCKKKVFWSVQNFHFQPQKQISVKHYPAEK